MAFMRSPLLPQRHTVAWAITNPSLPGKIAKILGTYDSMLRERRSLIKALPAETWSG